MAIFVCLGYRSTERPSDKGGESMLARDMENKRKLSRKKWKQILKTNRRYGVGEGGMQEM